MTTQAATPTYVFGRRDRGGMLLGFRASQLALLALGTVAVLIGFLTDAERGGLIGLALFGLAAFIAVFPIQGRPAVDWVRPLSNYAIQRVTGTGRYLGGPRALHRSRFVPALQLPGRARQLRVYDAYGAHGKVALLKLKDRWTVVLEVRCPNYVLADRASQERRVAAWGALLAQCGQEGSRIDGLQWLERTIPDSGRGLRSGGTRRGDPAPLTPRHTESSSTRPDPTATRHETYLAVSIDTHGSAG